MSTAVMSASTELQGIGSILGSSEHQRANYTPASLRRTLSADMSSKTWLSKNGFCPLKRIASNEELKLSNDEDDEERNEFQNWNAKKEKEPPGESDIWSSIVLEKTTSLPTPPTPYVHPLAKRSRSLSQQSLEICTESLGSETGSDGFSSVPGSETSDEEHEDEQDEQQVKEASIVHTYTSSFSIKKSPPRSFPPPLPSLSQSGLHMRSHRVDGRLVLEAVPVPAHNYFQAQREGGRLLLTFANPKPSEVRSEDNIDNDSKPSIEEEDEEEVMFQEEEDEDDVNYEDEESEEEEMEMERSSIVLEMKASQPTKKVPTGVINVHRSALNKLMGLTNIDPTWSPKLEKMVNVGDGDDTTPLAAHSLPPPPPLVARRLLPTAASSFNTYDYCWRTKSSSVAVSPTVCAHPLTQHPPPLNNKTNKFLLSRNLSPEEQQEVGLMRGNKADYLVPFFHGCKEPRRSLYVWEPHCIAT